MSEDNAIIVSSQPESRFLAPAATIQQAVERFQVMGQFVKSVMRENVDYGIIPGTDKPTLYKPGAEKLTTLFGLSSRFEIKEKILDWAGGDHDGEPFFYFHYRCVIHSGERLIADGEGSCNSFEKKYRFRNADRTCPACGMAAIIKGKQEYGGGWLCFAKKGGCGAKYKDNDPSITDQKVGQVKNPETADLVNTIQKMAQKRSYVAAVLLATNASEYFTQDVEDFIPHMVINGEVREVEQADGKVTKAKYWEFVSGKLGWDGAQAGDVAKSFKNDYAKALAHAQKEYEKIEKAAAETNGEAESI